MKNVYIFAKVVSNKLPKSIVFSDCNILTRTVLYVSLCEIIAKTYTETKLMYVREEKVLFDEEKF